MSGKASVLLGVMCLLLAAGLAWFSPAEGVAGLLGKGVGDGKAVGFRTKVLERDGGEVFERSVAEEYVRKAERGMSADEVRWVVEDFLAAGLDVDYPEDTTAEGYLGLRKAREEWYLGALVSGLRLTKEQVRQAKEAMGVLRENDFAAFLEYLNGVKSFEHEGKTMQVIDGGKARLLMDARNWLKKVGYQPWLLCQLDEEQLAVTWGDPTLKTRHGSENRDGGSDRWLWKEPGKEGMRAGFENQDPFEPSYVENLEEMGGVFPLNEIQFRRLGDIRDTTVLSEMRILQPEQLKMYILYYPEEAAALMKELEKLGE